MWYCPSNRAAENGKLDREYRKVDPVDVVVVSSSDQLEL